MTPKILSNSLADFSPNLGVFGFQVCQHKNPWNARELRNSFSPIFIIRRALIHFPKKTSSFLTSLKGPKKQGKGHIFFTFVCFFSRIFVPTFLFKLWFWVLPAVVAGKAACSTTEHWRTVLAMGHALVIRNCGEKSAAIIHPRKLTCPLKRDYFSREYIFQPLIFRGHVNFQGSTLRQIVVKKSAVLCGNSTYLDSVKRCHPKTWLKKMV